MIIDKDSSIRLSSIMTAIIFCLAGIGLYAKTVALIAPSSASICLIWAAYHFLSRGEVSRFLIRGRSILLIFTAHITWLVCLTGGIFSPGLFFFIIVMAGTVLFDDLFGFFVVCSLLAALLAFFYWGPSQGPGVLNLYEFRFVFCVVLFSGIGSVLFLILKKQHHLISEQQRIIESSQKCREDAKSAIKVKDRFLANMSHEIRNPMNGVLGMLHVLLDSELDAEQRRFADTAYNSAKALLTIVNDILDLSKIEEGKVELDIRPFDLEIAVKDMASLPELQARQKGLEFTYNIDTDVPRLLKGDIGRIRQVILNFMSNAVKFTDTGSVTLNVTLREDNETQALIHFSVDDTGIGIREDALKDLFSPFVQADASITKKYGGTGLGLSISKLFIELMGGRVGVESVEMIGSTFWFEVPFEKQAAEEIAQNSSILPTNEIRVVAVSDKPESGTRLTKILDRIGFDYKTCEHNQLIEHLTLASTNSIPFHVVIMEVGESDQYARNIGLEFQRNPELNSLARILVTAVGKQGDAREFEALGFSAFLSFPLDKSMLEDAVHTVLSPTYRRNRGIITRFTLAERKKRSFKILIVDDIETNVLTVIEIIRKQGYLTDSAANGFQAVEKAKKDKYDLIFMDCRMPEMDGYEAVRQIRAYEALESLAPTPIIAMTGNAFERDRQRCKSAGMDEFIPKPVNPHALIELINRYTSETYASAVFVPSNLGMPDHERDDAEHQIPASTGLDDNDALVSIFDRTGFLERFGNDEEIASEVLASFFQEVEGLLDNLVSAVKKDPFDPEDVEAFAHALKGAAANVNADQLKSAAFDIEIQARNGIRSDPLVVSKILKKCLNRFNEKAIL